MTKLSSITKAPAVVPYKFVKWEAGAQIKIDDPKKFVARAFKHSAPNSNLVMSGVYRLGGWEYNLRPYLKNFVYKQHNTWYEVWAPSKTALRHVTYGRIDDILERVRNYVR
jgi:hypothetical protein